MNNIRRGSEPSVQRRKGAFTLIELLVVISIISLLISILLPSLSRARDQAKMVHCLARLKEFGNAIATYENLNQGALPPAKWVAPVHTFDPRYGAADPSSLVYYGWTELLFAHVYGESVGFPQSYPVQRNLDPRRWQKYFTCNAAGDDGPNSGHYRVYLPAWSAGSFALDSKGVWGDDSRAVPTNSASRERISPRLPLLGDANEKSERGDGFGIDDSSFIDAGEADYAGSDGRSNGNRFSDRHSGGTNYLFPDLHGSWDPLVRLELARDYDLNHVVDVPSRP